MVFSSTIFLFMFLPIFLISYFLAKKTKTKNIILVLFSLIFYAWGEPYYIFIMILSIIINYYLTILMDKKKSKAILILLIIINIGLLFSFKYVNFFINNINYLLNLHIRNINLALPIGISFYTFQTLSYVIDVYKRKVNAQKNIIKLACYISAFPQLIAGPIVRYIDIEKELNQRNTTKEDFSDGIRRFIIGLSKKVLIANNVAFICDALFLNGIENTGFIGIVIASIAYTLQIYYDFSGYSDMAIGLGRICGFKYMENFNYPYISKNITDFWRRWHISLSSFFKDYVYIPLGGSKTTKFKHIRNILIVWILTGMWHGAEWNFIIWGLYYGILLLIEKYLIKEKIKNSYIYHILTLIIITIGWLIFRETNFNELITSFKALFGVYGFGSISSLYYIGILSSRYILAFVLGIIFSRNIINDKFKNSFIFDLILIILLLICIIYIVVGSYNPFIYYRF
ncbi:MAG: MBOAT family protein [Bacilli bacterium]|nr:MBOAT family protein [Bacilli bacterium]